MKKITVTFITLTILFHPVFAQLKKPEAGKIEDGAIRKYKIAEIKIVSQNYVDGIPSDDSIVYIKKYYGKGLLISEMGGQYDFQKTYVYDKKGNCVNYICYSKRDVVARETMTYNNRNLLAESLEYYQSFKYFYDTKDSLVKLERFQKSNLFMFTVYKYNNKHYLIKKTEYMADSSVAGSEIYQYNSFSNLTGHRVYKGERLELSEDYKYDEHQKLTGSTVVSVIAGDSAQFNYVFQYDAQNRLIHIMDTCSTKPYLTKETYEYDKHDNVTRHAMFNENHLGEQVSSCTWEYFYDGMVPRCIKYKAVQTNTAKIISSIINYYITFY